jgi:hypothetical protein
MIKQHNITYMKKVKHIRTGAEFEVIDFGKKVVHLRVLSVGNIPYLRVGDKQTTSIAGLRANYSANFTY